MTISSYIIISDLCGPPVDGINQDSLEYVQKRPQYIPQQQFFTDKRTLERSSTNMAIMGEGPFRVESDLYDNRKGITSSDARSVVRGQQAGKNKI